MEKVLFPIPHEKIPVSHEKSPVLVRSGVGVTVNSVVGEKWSDR